MGVRGAAIQAGRKEAVVLLTTTSSTDSKRERTQKTVLVRLKSSVHSTSPHTGIEPTSASFVISFASTTVML
jgi:hypothetical protein|tara:strand:- start:496 stop:711 length:216 start_codon:yes stop_codon:yes gene_type:complete